jgi:adenosylcobinamide kinase/adenosylcobinamide-phosphate guanylyltransferase
MVLIIGGRAQGKLEYAKNKFGVTEYSDGCFSGLPAVYNLQDAVRTLLNANQSDIFAVADEYIAKYPDAVIICDEVGCGVVPVDKGDRIWREAVGRLCCYLAERADSVHRVFCGIGTVIK